MIGVSSMSDFVLVLTLPLRRLSLWSVSVHICKVPVFLYFFLTLSAKGKCCVSTHHVCELWNIFGLGHSLHHADHGKFYFLDKWLFKIVYWGTSNSLTTVLHMCAWFIKLKVTWQHNICLMVKEVLKNLTIGNVTKEDHKEEKTILFWW